MSNYLQKREFSLPFPFPLEGSLDLTYRCNNNCRHCWVRIPSDAKEKEEELSLNQIRGLLKEARNWGCHQWSISGGEPMLRPDFPEILDFIIQTATHYSLNTNGTLINPRIARLLRKPGTKMVSLFGATAEVHDGITRTPGSFEAAMQGIAYLREAKAGFILQLTPMRSNYHQWAKMIELAQALSPDWRIGATWLYLRRDRDSVRNREIIRERLSPKEIVNFIQPIPSRNGKEDGVWASSRSSPFASCLAHKRDFHMDPYGKISFCAFIQEPSLRYDLRHGNLKEYWESFLPSLFKRIPGGKEYREHCGSCKVRSDCLWCPAYGYLEHGRFTSPIRYLCAITQTTQEFKRNWERHHRRHYQVGGITFQIDSDLPISKNTFHTKLKPFEGKGLASDTIRLHHHFFLPPLHGKNLGQRIYRRPPWAIYRRGDSWIYMAVSPGRNDRSPYQIAVWNHDHTRGEIFHGEAQKENFLRGNHTSLTIFPTDQILLARLLPFRNGGLFHSAGLVLEGQGLLFVGHSEAGKSTLMEMVKEHGEILCDDRIIVRKWPEGYKIHGTWSHGDVSQISPCDAPLKAVLFLEKAGQNRICPVEDPRERIRRMTSCLIKSLVTADWWKEALNFIEGMVQDLPFYRLYFDRTGRVVHLLREIVGHGP